MMTNEIKKAEYQHPEIIVTAVENDIITFSETKVSWEGPIVNG